MAIAIVSQVLNIPFFSDPKEKPDWAVGKSGHVSTRFWNQPLIKPSPERDSAKGKSGYSFERPTITSPVRDSAVGKSGHVSTRFWNYPLLKAPPRRDSAVGKSGHVSKTFFPFPLIIRRVETPT